MKLKRNSNAADVTLGKELGRGGEGAVYAVTDVSELVAKIYLKPPVPAKAEKLQSMARNASSALLRVAAWPVDLLSDEEGNVRGFLMPKVSAREDVHELYSPKSRRQAFPGIDFRFLVRAGTNIARAFAQVHAAGDVIGDVNHGNALVGHDGTVMLIDCDSFQVHDGERVYTCDVGVLLFTPPELAGHAFRGLQRTPNHDAFGLAVLLFHLLFLGRHPYAGKFADGEMPIERAIAESRFVYGVHAASMGMSRPPGTLALDAYGADVAELFERAFAPPGSTRPTATEWIDALQALESRLVVCPANAAHFYPPRRSRRDGGDPGCCWCAIEHHTGLSLFGERRDAFDSLGTSKLAPIWDAITSVPRPNPVERAYVPDMTDHSTKAEDPLGPAPSLLLAGIMGVFAIGSVIATGRPGVMTLVMFLAAAKLLWKLFNPRSTSRYRPAMHATLYAARKRLASVANAWNELVDDPRFDEQMAMLQNIKDQLLELPKRRQAQMQAMRDQGVELQRSRYLDQFHLDKAKLPDVTRQEISMLAAFDIDTAAEVRAHAEKMRGLISEKARLQALAWANACERNFRAAAPRDLPSEDVHEIDAQMRKEQEMLLAQLDKGHARLEQIAQDIAAARDTREHELAAASKAVSAASKRVPQ